MKKVTCKLIKLPKRNSIVRRENPTVEYHVKCGRRWVALIGYYGEGGRNEWSVTPDLSVHVIR
jgi:hypothetical protein